MSPCPVPPGLAWRLDLNVPHIDLLIEQEHRRPLPLLAPVLRVGDLLDIDDVDFGLPVPQPVPASSIHESLQFSLAVVLMVRIGPMVVVPFVKYDSNQSKLSSGLGVLEWLEPKLVIDVPREQDVVKVHIIHLVLA